MKEIAIEDKKHSPISWVPTLYFAMGLPFVMINMAATVMFRNLEISDAQIAFWTSLIMYQLSYVTMDSQATMESVLGNV